MRAGGLTRGYTECTFTRLRGGNVQHEAANFPQTRFTLDALSVPGCRIVKPFSRTRDTIYLLSNPELQLQLQMEREE